MRRSVRAVLEVTLVFLGVIGACKILDSFRGVGWIARHDVVAIGAACLFLYVPLALLQISRREPRDYGITLRGSGASLRTALAVSAVVLPAFLLLYVLCRKFCFHAPARIVLPAGWSLLLIYHLVGVALPEEVFYRGYMQSRLNTALPGRVRLLAASVGVGWLYTALLFALGHFLIAHRLERLATFFPGLLFGWLRERTGSIVAPTLVHGLCNFTVLLVA
ncbi:MAG: CPBP family intramembrane glutamic endopeptidase [bacterium]